MNPCSAGTHPFDISILLTLCNYSTACTRYLAIKRLYLFRTYPRVDPLGASFRQKWSSSENVLRVEGYDCKTGVRSRNVSHRRSRSDTGLSSPDGEVG